jgi:molybdopterin/thiamine biosynthesis adenylyltransferase
MYKLKEAVIVIKNETGVILQLGTQRWNIKTKDERFYNFIMRLPEVDYEELDSDEREFFAFLKKEHIIVKVKKYASDRFLKNQYYFEDLLESVDLENDIQEKINNKRIALIGLGGIGTVVIQNLVEMGVGHLILIDGDEVEVSNLNRQVYYTVQDIGKRKTEALFHHIKDYDSFIEITVVDKFINRYEDLSFLDTMNLDLIVNAADQPKDIMAIVAQKSQSLNCGFITGGVGLHTGMWTKVLSGSSLKSAEKIFERTPNGEPLKGSISATNSLIASLISNEILFYFCNENVHTTGKKFYITFSNYEITEEEYE